ncbi:hypothetical protein Moror_13012, partial [Moniliophthora roreri MCA 2997]
HFLEPAIRRTPFRDMIKRQIITLLCSLRHVAYRSVAAPCPERCDGKEELPVIQRMCHTCIQTLKQPHDSLLLPGKGWDQHLRVVTDTYCL